MSIPLTSLPLARVAVPHAGWLRDDPHTIETLQGSAATRVILVHGDLVATDGAGKLALVDPPTAQRLADSDSQVATQCVWVFLGACSDIPEQPPQTLGEVAVGYLALLLPPAQATTPREPEEIGEALTDKLTAWQWRSVRDIGDSLDASAAGLAVSATALAAWHARHPRCSLCGEATVVTSAGWVRRCPADGSHHFPRTDPAVIMTVRDSRDRLLLAHARHWPAGRYSTVAGFVEPGEAAEAAVRREVYEETRLRVRDVTYLGSQPWPFPASLMLAFDAVADDDSPVPDGDEITDARWFTREELRASLASGQVGVPMVSSVARAMIERWLNATD